MTTENLESKFLQDFYNIGKNNEEVFNFEEYERTYLGENTIIPPGEWTGIIAKEKHSNRQLPVFLAVLFVIKLGGEILKNLLQEIAHENSSNGAAKKRQ
ncbi:unnamed protein product [Rhizophagus irregularis]|nr:unnamed protein product [Rhizophagus irregularis]CAB4446045.1 unnamed protein product [Rhizophagus irregularis]